jgi:hypothetical protein
MNTLDVVTLTDAQWIEQTLDAMLTRDPVLNRWDVQPLVEEMAQRPRWRAMPPGDAAAKVFGEKDLPV